jgi:hypothetical protein
MATLIAIIVSLGSGFGAGVYRKQIKGLFAGLSKKALAQLKKNAKVAAILAKIGL